MNIIRNNFGHYSHNFNELIENIFSSNLANDWLEDLKSQSPFRPKVNIAETDAAYEMQVSVPGIAKEDIVLAVEKDTLTISYSSKEEKKEDNGSTGFLRTEFRAQSFKRSFSLDAKVHVAAISASYNDGILNITLPKVKAGNNKVQHINVN